MPAVFVRLGKCNLACGWCDTDYLKFGMMSLSDILGRLKTYTARNIIITGGEPTIQPHLDTLLDALKAEGYFLCIETNGLKPAPPQIDYVATSPKACYADKYETNCIAKADEVRIVADGDVVAFCEKHGTQNPRAPLLPFALRKKRRDEHLRHHPPNRSLKQPLRRARALAVERADAQMGGDRVGFRQHIDVRLGS